MSLPAITARLIESVGRVVQRKSTRGTAVVISPDQVLTSAHVIGSIEEQVVDAPEWDIVFAGSVFKFKVLPECIDWKLDIAVLVKCAPAVELPPAIPIHVTSHAELVHQQAWVTWGFPPVINKNGFGLAGYIVSHHAILGDAAPALQLSVVQNASSHLGGVSGSPVIVDGRCVGLIREYPLAVENGTLYATPLDAALHIAAIREAADRGRYQLPASVRPLIDAQAARISVLRMPPTRRGSRRVGHAYVQPQVLDEAGVGINLVNICHAALPGAVVFAQAGVGKSRFLAELMSLLIHDLRLADGLKPIVPLLLHGPDLFGPGDIVDRIENQRRYPIRRNHIREPLERGQVCFLFLIDALDEGALTDGRAAELAHLLLDLDGLCRAHGHRWIGTCRTTRESAVQLPSGTSRLMLAPFDPAKSRELLRQDFPDSGERVFEELLLRESHEILSNPFMLCLAAEIRSDSIDGAMLSPARVVREFLLQSLSCAQDALANGDAGSLLDRTLREVDPPTLAAAYAKASLLESDPDEELVETLQRRTGLSLGQCMQLGRRFVDTFLVDTTLVSRPSGGASDWQHELFRDALVANALVDTVCSDSSRLEECLQLSSEPRWRTPVAMMIALLPKRFDPVDAISIVDGPQGLPLTIEFLSMGGRLPPVEVAALIDGLDGLLHEQKHLAGRCSLVLSSAVDAFGSITQLAFLPEARSKLITLSENIALDVRWRRRLSECLKRGDVHGSS